MKTEKTHKIQYIQAMQNNQVSPVDILRAIANKR
jgi:hypothetical protein